MVKLQVAVTPYSESERVMEFLARKLSYIPQRIIREPNGLDAIYYEFDMGKSEKLADTLKEAIEKKLLSPPYATVIGDALYGLYRIRTVNNDESLEDFIHTSEEA